MKGKLPSGRLITIAAFAPTVLGLVASNERIKFDRLCISTGNAEEVIFMIAPSLSTSNSSEESTINEYNMNI